MITKHNAIQGSREWQVMREGRYTGQNAHKLLKYGAIEYSLTQAVDVFSTFWISRGKQLEKEALELYEVTYHVEVERPGIVYNSLYPKCAYSPDGLCGQYLLEVKCFNEDYHLELIKKKVEELPLEILAQVYFGMLICEMELAQLIFYHPKVVAKDAFKIFEIPRDRKIQANFKDILKGERNAQVL